MPDLQDDPREALRERLDEAQRRRAAARAADDKAAWILAAYACGRAHFDLGEGDLPFALRLFGEAMKLIEESGSHRALLPELLGMTGRTLQRMKRWDDVLPWYRRATEEASAQGLAAQQLRWLGKEATTWLAINESERGRELLEKAIETGRAMLAAGKPVAEPLADQMQHLANLDTTEKDKSDALWEEAEQLLATLPKGHAHFLAAVNRAASYTNRDQPWVAQTYLEEALEVGAAVGIDETDRRQLALRLAALLCKRNEPVQAGERLLAYLPQCGDDRGRHEVLTAAVDAFFQGHAWDRMKSACEPLRKLRRHMAPGWQYDVEMRCSIACRGLKQFDESMELLRKALEFAQRWGNPDGLTKVRGQIAVVLLDKGDFAESAHLGEELWAEGVRNPLAARTLVRALIGKGDLGRAEAVAAEFEQADGERLEAARLRAYLADAGRGDPRAAWYAVGMAAGRVRSAEAEALTHLMALAPAGSKDRFEQAWQRLRVMDYARVQVNDVFSDASWRAAIEYADEFGGWLDDFVTEALVGDHDEATIYELERFRAQTLVNLLAERKALWSLGEVRRGWLKGTMTSRLQRERYRFEALTARGAGWRERRAVAQEVERLGEMAFSAEGLIHFAPADQGLHFPQDLPELLGEHRLAEGECLLFAHPLPDRFAMWAWHARGRIDHTTFAAFGRSVVDRMGHTLRTIGYSDTPPDVDALLGELDALCGKPLAAWLAQLGVRRAFLAAGTSLATLPLDCCAALLEPGAPELIMLPSGAAIGFTRGVRKPLPETLYLVTQADRDRATTERMQAARGRVLVVVDPSRDLDFAPLEGAMVSAAQRTQQLEVLDQDRLDASSLAIACGHVDVLHFIGHGRFDAASPYRSGVAIGPLDAADTLWTNADIFSDVEAPAGRLAVLSGCETGQTRPNLVSEEVSLPAAFIAAGYAAVVASRWAVDDLSATLLMAEFHRRWNAGGTSVAVALAASRRWLRDLSRDDAHTLVSGLADTAAGALPARAEECRHLCSHASELLDQEGEHPFANPLYWAAFFVAGDGAITANGVDPRVPTRRGRPAKRRRPQ